MWRLSLQGRLFEVIGLKAVPALIQALGDEKAQVRSFAANALVHIGPPAKEAAPVLIQMFCDKADEVRKAAVQALVKIDPEAKEIIPAFESAKRTNNTRIIDSASKAVNPLIKSNHWLNRKETTYLFVKSFLTEENSFVFCISIMELGELRDKQGEFEGNRQELRKKARELERLRMRFVTKYSPDKLRQMSIDDYVVGHGSGDTFCYWLEIKLMELGKIQGGSTAGKKFGIYYGRTKSDSTVKYRFLKRFGSDSKEAYRNVRAEVLDLIDAGKRKDFPAIAANKLSPMFKGKILSTYFPNRYLNIFSAKHLDYFLEATGLMSVETPKLTEVEKRELLLNFKNSDVVMRDWSMFEYYNFLYEKFGRPVSNPDEVSRHLRDYVALKFPPLGNVNAEFVSLMLADLKEISSSTRSTGRTTKIDFEKKNKMNKALGDRGEEIVLKAEKDYLRSIKRPDLIKKVEYRAKESDKYGYDILSFDERGNEKYIEVKSTKSKVSDVEFFISDTEKKQAEELQNYYVYIVFEAHTANPKVYKLKKPFSLSRCKIRVTPVNYKVLLNLKR